MIKLFFEKSHALEAIDLVKKNGVEWLYDNYPKPNGNKRKSITGFLMYEGTSYPVKPLGRLASEIANAPMEKNWITNVFREHFSRLGFELVNSPDGEAEAAAERQRRIAKVWARPEQAKFRRKVFKLFGERCIITGCESLVALEAAHILPVSEGGEDEAWNGIPLRADLHRLFDDHCIVVEPFTWKVHIALDVLKDYGQYHGIELAHVFNTCGLASKLSDAFHKRMELEG